MGSMAMYSIAKYKGEIIAIGAYSAVPSVNFEMLNILESKNNMW